MRSRTATALAILVLGPSLAVAPPASADPPELLTGTVVGTSYTPLPDLRRETGPVVHFAFETTSAFSGDVQAVTEDRYSCLRVDDVIRCRGTADGTIVDDEGQPTGGTTRSHVKLTCDAMLYVCEATSHYVGRDDDGRLAVGSGTISTVGGVGTYEFLQTRP